jgi:hypothetical protein
VSRGWVVLAWVDQRPAVTGQRSGRWGPEAVVSAVPWRAAGLDFKATGAYWD